MELADRLAELLKDYSRQNRELTGWRFDLQEARGIEIGLKNNRLGGPYSAPGYKRSISGELYLIWTDQRFTSAKLDSRAMNEFSEYMNIWRATAYTDPDGVGLYRPESIPRVDLADRRVSEIIDRDYQLPFQLLIEGLERLTAYGLNKIDGKIRCFEGRRVLMDSEGLVFEAPQTPVEFFFKVNDSYGEGYREKKWPDRARIERIIKNTGEIGRRLTTEAGRKLSGKMRLLFPPDVLESFLSQFLLGNLYGSLVVNRQSRFSLEDFQNHSRVLRDDLSLVVNTLIPHRFFSYACTSEAVPGGTVAYINAGKLQTPVLSLKYAKKAGMKPTPVPVGFFLKSTQTLPSWEELVRRTDIGVIVYSVLGMHTQDVASGHFSLTADQCLLVEQGKIVGKVKGVISGDFLGSLLQDDSQLALVEGEDNPGYAFWAMMAE